MASRDWEIVIVAHRGMVVGFPENTLAAFRKSIEMGFSAIEIDLRATVDGHIVVMHDDTVDRTTSGRGMVSELTLAEIRSLDAGSHAGPEFAGQKVPTSGLIERMHQLGKPVWTTADVLYRDIDPERPRDELAELVRLGTNGILTDIPETLRDVLATSSQAGHETT
jgi:glycerophosphoryl diester phosphodiesterase